MNLYVLYKMARTKKISPPNNYLKTQVTISTYIVELCQVEKIIEQMKKQVQHQKINLPSLTELLEIPVFATQISKFEEKEIITPLHNPHLPEGTYIRQPIT